MPRRWIALALCSACSVGGVDKPDPPDASQVLASFAAPTGSVASLDVLQRAAVLLTPLEQLQLLCGSERCADGGACQRCRMTDAVSRSLRKVADALDGERKREDGGIAAIPELANASGLLQVTTICDGWGKPVADPVNGSVAFSVGFTGRGFDPAGSGKFSDCAMLLDDDSRARLDGTLLYAFQPPARVPFAALDAQPLVVAFDGTLAVEGPALPLQVALLGRMDQPPALSFEVAGIGSFVAVFDGDAVDIEGRDQKLRCQLREKTCDVTSPR